MNHCLRKLAVIAAFFATVFPAGTALAAPGDLDTTFGTTGYVLTQLDTANSDRGFALAIQPDQKIVVAGECMVQGDLDFCVARYLPNGTLDTTFGLSGIRKVIVGSLHDRGRALVLLPDGRMIVGGFCDNGAATDFCLIRLTAAGSLDTTFGTNGKVFTDFEGKNDELASLALGPDGTIVAVGSCRNAADNLWNVCVAKYTATGALDVSFSADGKLVRTTGGPANYHGRAVLVQADGYIIVGGQLFNATNTNALRYFSRLTPSGGTSVNYAAPNFDNTAIDNVLHVVEQADGQLVFTGACKFAASLYGLCLTRVSPSLVLDTSLANDAAGVARNNMSDAHAVMQSDGKLVAASFCRSQFDIRDQLCLDRFHSDGKYDSSFGVDGSAFHVFASSVRYKQMHGVALQADGQIVVAGACEESPGGPVRFCVARFDGGPRSAQACRMDIDGDNVVRATTDGLILSRVALGMTGSAVTTGVSFPVGATRTTWADIRNYLVTQCGMALAP